MIKDRGTKKWSASFVLPEHASLLKKIYEEMNDIKKPLVDEHQLEEMNLTFHLAIESNLEVKIKYFSHNRIHETKGFIKEIDYLYKKVCIVNENKTTINLLDIIDVLIV